MEYLSAGCRRLTGYDSHELVGSDRQATYNDITVAEDLPRVLETIQQAAQASRPYVTEYRIRTRFGEIKWVWEKGSFVVSEAGKLEGLEGFITDITELKIIEAALRESEVRYRLLAENSQDLISRHHFDGTCLYASPASQLILGYSPQQLREQPWETWIHPEDQALVLDVWRRAQFDSQTRTLCFRMRHCNGHYRWLETVSLRIDGIDLPGESELLSIARDITDHREAERQLRARESFLHLILNNIPQAIFWKDLAGVYCGCNQAFANAVGATDPAAIIGKTDYELLPLQASEAAYFRARDQLVISRGEPDLHVLELQPYADGQDRWVDCSKLPIRDESGQVMGVLCTFEDVSDRLAAQRALAQREQYLAALVDIQRQLLAVDLSWSAADLNPVLARLGEVSGASRVYIYEFYQATDSSLSACDVLEWCAPGIESTINLASFQAVPVTEQFTDWLTTLEAVGMVNLIESEFTEGQRQLLCQPPSNVKSLLLLPLRYKGHLIGIIGFSNCTAPQRWEQSEVDLLQIAAASLSLSLERRQAEDSLQEAEAKYRSIFENSVEGIFQSTLAGQYLTVNPMLAKLYGYRSPTALIANLTDIEHQLYVDPLQRQVFLERMQQQGAVLGFESQIYRRDGSIIWISESARAIHNEAGEVIAFEGTVEDITQRKRDEMAIRRRDRLLQGVSEASQWLLTSTDLIKAIPRVLKILGQAAEADRAYLYENHPHLVSGEMAMSMRYEWTRPGIPSSIQQSHWQNQPYCEFGLQRWYQAFSQGQSLRGPSREFPPQERSLLQPDGIQSILMVPIFIDDALWGYIGFDACQDERCWSDSEESILVAIAASLGGAIKRQQAEAQMRYQAFHDPLTGLPNRSLFNQQLAQAIDAAWENDESLAVVFLDLDRFKNINDSLGHAIGDQLLEQVSQRLQQALRTEDFVARWGGDEFTLILPHLSSPQVAAMIAESLANALLPTFYLDGHELHISSSMGIALYPQDGNDSTTLLQHADAAMYQAKDQGRNDYMFYTATLNSEANRRLTLENHLHHALRRQELTLHYQPQFDVHHNQVIQFEALLRWQHPEFGMISPQTFIPIAEETGLIVPIGDWVLREVCLQHNRWLAEGLPPVRLAVNLSARQLQQPNLVERILEILQSAAIQPATLELEITETAAMRDLTGSIRTLRELRQAGLRISMDDFGTGYSSLSYLKRFPLHALKIDRTFVRDVATNPQDQAMVTAIIAMARGLGLHVVAEGVETEAQRQCLYELNCREMQGYLFSPPLATEDVLDFMGSHSLYSGV